LLSGDAEWGDIVEKVYVTYEHPPTAVSLDTEIVEGTLRIIAALDCLLVLLIDMGNHLAAAPTPYWNQHSILTCTTSATSFEHHVPFDASAPYGVGH